ncbi:uncharacterized protein LOC108734417 isoform X2 [Agrilus planipennis]|uniref:Uncharacterized protein LOC108734417 isoform X2 n=1 Tax=Agrilus planipennis TaxID=224129 RepID=A0A7F5R5S7_AGRPL|nr:uncharacterized protein LOC108734417 isoform X2 [Agrilus planipennis]
MSLGTEEKHAQTMANTLAEADYRGRYRHGLTSLEMILEDVDIGACRPDYKPKILKETPAIAWVDGAMNLGPVVGNFCMDIAIKKAKEVGIGWVTCKHSNDYGLSTCYALRAYNVGFIGFACSNSPAMVVPTRGKKPVLGPNPICLAAPSKREEEGVIMDMTTSTVDWAEIDQYKIKGQELPKGWAATKDGTETTDISQATYLLPLGGTEDRSGYKGGKFGPYVKETHSARDPANLCHTFFALDPAKFNPAFKLHMQDLTAALRSTDSVTPDTPVWIAGDPERMHMKAVKEAGGIRYSKKNLQTFEEIAFKYGVTPLKAKDSCYFPS